jgi:hypothetical protein
MSHLSKSQHKEYRNRLVSSLHRLAQKIDGMSPEEALAWVRESKCQEAFSQYARLENALADLPFDPAIS